MIHTITIPNMVRVIMAGHAIITHPPIRETTNRTRTTNIGRSSDRPVNSLAVVLSGFQECLNSEVTLCDGDKVLIRPLRRTMLRFTQTFYLRVTAKDLRLRLFTWMRAGRPELIDKLIHYDLEHAIAFVAIAEPSGRLLGVVRLHDDPMASGEFAIWSARTSRATAWLANDEAHDCLGPS